MILRNLTIKSKGQPRHQRYRFRTGLIAIESPQSDRFLPLADDILNLLLVPEENDAANAPLHDQFDIIRPELQFNEDRTPVIIDLLRQRQIADAAIFTNLLFLPACSQSQILQLSSSQILQLTKAITLPYNYNFSEFFPLIRQLFLQNLPAANPVHTNLCKEIIREKDNCRLLTESIFQTMQVLHEKERELYLQTEKRDLFEMKNEHKKHLELQLGKAQKKYRDCRSKLRRIRKQVKQLANLAEIQRQVDQLRAEKTVAEKLKAKFERLKSLTEQAAYFSDEIVRDEQIVTRLANEIKALGNLELFALDISDREETDRAFVNDATAWLSAAEKVLDNLRAKGEQIKRNLSSTKNSEKQRRLEVELEKIRSLYIAKMDEIKKTRKSVRRIEKRQEQIDELRQELAGKQRQKEKLMQQIAEVEKRINTLKNELAIQRSQIETVGKVAFDPEKFENICAALAHSEKILKNLLQIERENRCRKEFEIEEKKLAAKIEKLERAFTKIDNQLHELNYDASRYSESVEKFGIVSGEYEQLTEKLASTRSVLSGAISEFCRQEENRQSRASQAWQHHRNKILTEAQQFINSVWQQSGNSQNLTQPRLNITEIEDPEWWQNQSLSRKRLTQLSLSYACSIWLRKMGIQVPEILLLDDSLAPENAAKPLRHRPVLQQLSRLYKQIIFTAESIPADTIFSQKIMDE